MKLGGFGFNQWKDPDYRVRLAYAQRATNSKKLLYLALNDVHESVRVAAVKNLPGDAARLEVVHSSSCDKSLRVALNMIDSDETRCEVAAIGDLDDELRLKAVKEVESNCEQLLLELARDESDLLALYAIERSEDVRGLEAIYSETLSDERCLALIDRAESEDLVERIFEDSVVHERRIAALRKVSDHNKLSAYYFKEHDPDVRSIILDRCDDQATLLSFFEDEDDELLRAKIASRIADSEWLVSVANNDYNMNVRRAAVQAIEVPSDLVEVALNNEDRAIHELVFQAELDDKSLFKLAKGAASSYARVEAVCRIEEESTLAKLLEEVELPDVTWFAGRRLGQWPIQCLRKLNATETLLRVAEEDSQKIIRITAMRQIKEKWALDQLAKSSNEEISSIAIALDRELENPTGIRFLQVPERPYQLSIFPITGEQFAAWKREQRDLEAASRYENMHDLPVADVSLDEATQYCQWLGTKDNARYRLPYFHEWKHVAVCDSPDWFSTGRLRAFANKEEAELVFFGNDSSPRPLHEAIPNPWGFLDTIGNVLEWTCDMLHSEEMLKAGISLDEFAQAELSPEDQLNMADYAYASGNHWGDRRIRSGRWKRLIHRNNLTGSAANKVGFRVIRIDSTTHHEPIEYELALLPDVSFGYTLDQVCWSVSRSLSIDYEEAKKRFVVAPYRLAILRDYAAMLRIKESWESHGALTELSSRPVKEIAGNNA